MDFPHEYALLFVVAAPVVVIVALNILLFFGGERETLLVPGLRAFPVIETQKDATVEPAIAELVVTKAAVEAKAPANDERVLEVA